MIYLIVIFPMVVSNYWYVKIWTSPSSLRILEMAFALKKTEAAHWKDYTSRNKNYANSQSSEQDPKKGSNHITNQVAERVCIFMNHPFESLGAPLHSSLVDTRGITWV